ncbi:myosin-11-like isoform X2 [Dermacentor silvarum]|uniref:myosin-11-like isoform X2 n=1 Tax=Dermacentor silvarum TaxID=543639 RepID=UPI002101CE02|nr:myosin-11-like isoform X2 [Dermacentor silvarum]
MLNRDKEAAVLQWLSCYNIKVRAISDLQDGLQLLKLLSTINPACCIENVEPGKTFPNIEKLLCEHHSCLPARFLSSGSTKKRKYDDLQLAVASVLALSALALRATSCSPTSEVAPLLKLGEATQCCIRDLIEIVNAGDDVLDNLAAYLKASNLEEESFLGVVKIKRRKSESFIASPTGAQTPIKRNSISPQQRARLPAHQVKEMRMLREHITDEEQANVELRCEGSRLKDIIKRKDREINSLKERLNALQSVSYSDASSLALLQKNMEETAAQNQLLQEQVHSLKRVREDYDTLIRQNVSLQAECEKMSQLQEECNNLKEDLSKALTEKSDLRARLDSVEYEVGELRCELGTKTNELDALVSFYSNKEKPVLRSPQALPQSPRLSCYTELRMVELQEANAKLQQESCRLQSELEETTARMQAEGNAMKATIVQLEEAKASLVAEVSQLNNKSTQLNIRISGLENELQLTKTTSATLESRLSIQASQSETLRQQLADKDQQIAALDEKSAASDAMNQELLKSNAELNAALRTSEVEKVAQAERMREVVAENRKHQDALSQQNSKLLALDATLGNLESKLAEAVGRSELLSSQLSVSEERCAKLEEAIATLRTELEASRSRCTELEQQLSQAGCEKEAQSSRLLKVQDELNSVTRRADQLQARAQELEASKQQLDTLCSELQHKLSESECQNRQAEKASAECARLKQCIEKSAAEKAELEVRLENEARVVHALKEKCAEHVAANENLCSSNATFKSTIEEAKLKMEHLEARTKEVNDENSALRNNLEATGQKLDTLLAEKQILQLKLSEASTACATLQKEVSEVRTKLCASEEQEQILRHANAGLDSFLTNCKQKLQVTESQLGDATRQMGALQEEVGFFQQLVTRLNLEKECLHSSLATAETASQSLEKQCQAAACTIEETRLKLKESRHGQMQMSSLVEQLQQECGSLKLVLADMSEKLSCREQELASAVGDRDKMASQVKELEDRQACLKHENQALEDRIGDLEVKLNNQLELKRKSEEDYYECVKERDAHKEALRQQIDELTAEAAEKARLQADLEELQNQCEGCKTSASDMGQLTEEKERLELKLASEQSESRTLIAERDELGHKVRELEKENEGLKSKLKSANEDCAKKLRGAFASFNAEMNKKITEMKKSSLALREEAAMWKEKCLNQQSLRERREALLKKHIAEMTENVKQSSKDTEALKAQTEEQAVHLAAMKEERDKLANELTAMTQERDRLASENRSLNAQLSYCDAKLREHSKKEAEKPPARGANQSMYSTPSLESIWSQRPLSSRPSRSSIASADEFKVPQFKSNPRRESSVSRSGQVAQAAALDSSIFSGNRFSCDEEQDLFSETTLAELSSQPEDPMHRYSELYRRNSMLPQHLKSVYPVETQQCPIPATPLKGDSKFTFPEVASTSAAAAPSSSVQRVNAAEDAAKRKRDARSSSSDDSNNKPPSFWGTAATPSKTKPKKSTQTPSSVKKFLRSRFKR